MATTRKRRGRRAAHYRCSDGKVINGLARRPSDGRWRVIGTGATFVEPDELKAIGRFREITGQSRARDQNRALMGYDATDSDDFEWAGPNGLLARVATR